MVQREEVLRVSSHFSIPHWVHAYDVYRRTEIFKYMSRSNKLDAKTAE